MKKHVKTPDEVREPVTYIKDPRLIPVSEIMAMEERGGKWLLEYCVPMGQVTSLVGPSDCGKSMFARQLAIHVSLGQPNMVGLKLNSNYRRVIYVSTEDDAFDWKEKLTRYQLTEEEIIILGSNMFLVTEHQGLVDLLEKELSHKPADLVVLDVFSDVFERDINNAIEVRKFMKPYKEMARKYKTTFLFIHHISKKGEASNVASKQNVLGSSGIESSMRSVIELRPGNNEDERILMITKGNYVPGDIKKKPIHLRLTEQLTFDRIDGGFSEKAERKDHLRQRVYELYDSGTTTLRDIEKKMKQEGLQIGKTSIGQYLKERKDTSIDHKKKEG